MRFAFEIEPFRKHCLLNGLDDIGLTLEHADEIRAFEAKRLSDAAVARVTVQILNHEGREAHEEGEEGEENRDKKTVGRFVLQHPLDVLRVLRVLRGSRVSLRR